MTGWIATIYKVCFSVEEHVEMFMRTRAIHTKSGSVFTVDPTTRMDREGLTVIVHGPIAQNKPPAAGSTAMTVIPYPQETKIFP